MRRRQLDSFGKVSTAGSLRNVKLKWRYQTRRKMVAEYLLIANESNRRTGSRMLCGGFYFGDVLRSMKGCTGLFGFAFWFGLECKWHEATSSIGERRMHVFILVLSFWRSWRLSSLRCYRDDFRPSVCDAANLQCMGLDCDVRQLMDWLLMAENENIYIYIEVFSNRGMWIVAIIFRHCFFFDFSVVAVVEEDLYTCSVLQIQFNRRHHPSCCLLWYGKVGVEVDFTT